VWMCRATDLEFMVELRVQTMYLDIFKGTPSQASRTCLQSEGVYLVLIHSATVLSV